MVARPLRAEGTPGSALRVTRALALLLLAYVLCSVVVPLQPLLGDGGLDGSWALALNQAVVQGLHFGTEVVFTYGPYASLLSAVYHPATDARMLWGSAYLALSFLLVLPVLLRGGSLLLWLALVLALVIAGEILLADLRRIYRYDLVMRHGRHDLAHAGFAGVVDASALRGAYRLRLGLRRNGAVQVCPGQEWAVSFAG